MLTAQKKALANQDVLQRWNRPQSTSEDSNPLSPLARIFNKTSASNIDTSEIDSHQKSTDASPIESLHNALKQAKNHSYFSQTFHALIHHWIALTRKDTPIFHAGEIRNTLRSAINTKEASEYQHALLLSEKNPCIANEFTRERILTGLIKALNMLTYKEDTQSDTDKVFDILINNELPKLSNIIEALDSGDVLMENAEKRLQRSNSSSMFALNTPNEEKNIMMCASLYLSAWNTIEHEPERAQQDLSQYLESQIDYCTL